VGEATGSAWIGAFRDADMDCRVACCDAVVGGTADVTAGLDADLGGTADVTAGLIRREEACRDAVAVCGVACRDTDLEGRDVCRDTGLGGIVDVATDPMCRDEACRDADLGNTADVTVGP